MKPVISLTSFGKRLSYVNNTINSLLKQSYNEFLIVLYIGENDIIPEEVSQLCNYKFQIQRRKDIGPYTKLMYALKDYPNNPIITVDDDIIYNPCFIQDLMESYTKNHDMIHSYCTRVMNDGYRLRSITNAPVVANETSDLYFMGEGYSGVLYPPHIFDEEVFNETVYKKYVPFNDDLWWFTQSVRMNVKHMNVVSRLKFCYGFNLFGNVVMKHGEEKGLHTDQNGDIVEKYDKPLQALFDYYGLMK